MIVLNVIACRQDETARMAQVLFFVLPATYEMRKTAQDSVFRYPYTGSHEEKELAANRRIESLSMLSAVSTFL